MPLMIQLSQLQPAVCGEGKFSSRCVARLLRGFIFWLHSYGE